MNATPEIKSRRLNPALIALACALVVLLALPVMQRLNTDPEPPVIIIDDPTEIEAPDYEDPPPPPPPPPDPKIQDLQDNKPKLTIDQIEGLMTNPDVKGYSTGDPIELPGTGYDNVVWWDIKDLSTPPRPLKQPSPIYPPEARQARLVGEVLVQFLVTEDGRTSSPTILQSTNHLFNEAALSAVRKWLFTPGERDGKFVKTRVRIRIPFNIGD
jgi:protein TonB